MPALNLELLKQLKDNYTNYPCFIETGTLNGDTIFAMEPYFKNLYTIEVSDKYYKQTSSRYTGNKITFLHGDSCNVFKTMLKFMSEKTIFFLDGHWSSGDTGRGEKDCPLIEEVTSINEDFKHQAVIIIDDYRLFGLNASSGVLGEDWSDISKEKVLNILKSRTSAVYHLDSTYAKDDRLIIHINAKY